MRCARFALLTVLFTVLSVSGVAATGLPDDPLKSPVWRDLAPKFFGTSPVVFDERVTISTPSITENQAQVPVTADARKLPGVTKMIVFADLNPIQHVLTLTPGKAAPFVSFRMKIEQATPIRAAAQTEDGTWHVGGLFLDAAGGGCSAPAEARKEADWSDTVGQAQGKLWREADGMARARIRLRHPMDTGLAKDNTPAYYIERVDVKSRSGASLATLEMFEPIAEDPTLTLILRLPQGEHEVNVDGRDNNGGLYHSTLIAPWRQSALTPAACGGDTPC
jgi:sulfur-oxidizing protein SoxY